jgi:hypothetical protein
MRIRKMASRIAVISLAAVSLSVPSIVAAQVPEGQRGALQNTTEDHAKREPQPLPPVTGQQYYRPCPASVVMPNGRHECLG